MENEKEIISDLSAEENQNAVPAEDTRGQWFVVHTLSGHEKKVRDSINRQIRLDDQVGVYEAYIPEEKVEDIRMGVKKVTTRKFFPGYILVRMDLYDEDGVVNQNAWYFVRSIQGVMGFLGNANRPKPLPEEEVVHVLRPPEAPRAKGQFKVGEVLCIKDGAFKGVEGKVMSVDTERGKLMLEVHTFGRPTPIEFEFWQVEHVV